MSRRFLFDFSGCGKEERVPMFSYVELQACRGFSESLSVIWRIVAADEKVCSERERGLTDRAACDDRHWGPNCRKECKCENGALCDPVRGVCQCPPGFIGRLCEDSCPAGTFGKGCQQKCKCGNGGSCNKATGECTCQKGFTGTFVGAVQVEIDCLGFRLRNLNISIFRAKMNTVYFLVWYEASLKHSNCAKTCKGSCQPRCPCQNEGRCKGNGVCACLAGWTGAICTEQCPEGRFGKNCSEECVCHNDAKCEPLTGRCQCREGFTGNRVALVSTPNRPRRSLAAFFTLWNSWLLVFCGTQTGTDQNPERRPAGGESERRSTLTTRSWLLGRCGSGGRFWLSVW
ncbi:hypothetical protein CCH79_00015499 [Gambusia affinis]|uniref:EGF-like domain-containing protein n=1 Tax=Gambusia affinis TaxID=33528 RepID=A0A315VNZ4_GAMAF|nr:hypothetical protein CCH79_00015499 [Gambusia affinis]